MNETQNKVVKEKRKKMTLLNKQKTVHKITTVNPSLLVNNLQIN